MSYDSTKVYLCNEIMSSRDSELSELNMLYITYLHKRL